MSRDYGGSGPGMYETPAQGTHFYRVIAPGWNWRHVLSGMGAYHTLGSRYNRPHQRAVYMSDDPLIAITEAAFYQAVDSQRRIGGGPPPTPPLVAPLLPPSPPFVKEHRLWCFTLNPAPQVIAVEDQNALQVFQHTLYALLNPSQFYRTTQDLADAIRTYPSAAALAAQGIKAPSVRMPPTEPYLPHQYVVFVGGQGIAGTLVRRWRLTIEFLDAAGQPVTRQTRNVDWSHPRFQLHGSAAQVPAFAARPGAQAFQPKQWYAAEINYS